MSASRPIAAILVTRRRSGSGSSAAERLRGLRRRAGERLVGAGPLGLVARRLGRLGGTDALGDRWLERLASERELLLGDTGAACQLPHHLQGRHALAALDSRD